LISGAGTEYPTRYHFDDPACHTASMHRSRVAKVILL
jgi:hypothetical protein